MQFVDWYKKFKREDVFGRFIHPLLISHLYENLFGSISGSIIGTSVENRPIYKFVIGNGSRKLLLWSQMHGNESTTTKACLDLFNFLQSNIALAKEIRATFELHIVPMLNPDGALAYTRINANGVDLNRDALLLTQPESRVLRQAFEEIQPEICFNLHGQRTIFNVSGSGIPATMSFLTPATEETRSITPSRKVSMQIIAGINQVLQKIIPNAVGRYDDSYNINCTGDYFQTKGTPTILFEAGHFAKDYQREKTRELVFVSLLASLEILLQNSYTCLDVSDYLAIPENDKRFYDIIIENGHLLNPSLGIGDRIGVMYKEVLVNEEVKFCPEIKQIGMLENKLSHQILDAKREQDLAVLKKFNLFSNYNLDES